jgi:Ca2+-dependent lipid-binding protein
VVWFRLLNAKKYKRMTATVKKLMDTRVTIEAEDPSAGRITRHVTYEVVEKLPPEQKLAG